MPCLSLREASPRARSGLSQASPSKKKKRIHPCITWWSIGTSSGLGRCLVGAALRRGDRVIATARDVNEIKDLRTSGAYIMQLDVRDDLSVIQRKAAEAIKVYGRIDVVGEWPALDEPYQQLTLFTQSIMLAMPCSVH